LDGSRDGQNARFVTLGGIIASEIIWSKFDLKWNAALPEEVGCFHMADAMAQPPQKAFRGWPEKKIQESITRLLNVLGEFNDEPMFIKSCTVDLKAHAAVRHELRPQQKIFKPPESMCVDYCLGSAWPIDPVEPDARLMIEIYFDRNEPFLNKIDSVWRRARKKKTAGWPRQIKQIVQVSKAFPAIQAADMIAWLMNAKYCGNQREQGMSFMLHLLGPYHAFFDYDLIKERYSNG